MNIQAMMAQAKKLQKEIEKTSEEIDSTVFNYENDNILIECYGSNKVKSIKIKNDEILEDKEMLEDILLVGYNNKGYAFHFNSSEEISGFIESLK